MKLAPATLCSIVLMLAQPAAAADKVVAGTLGCQAPLWAIYVAVHKGFFAAEGIDLELNFIQSGAAVVQQLAAGSLDVALSVGITNPIHAIDKGAPVALVRIVGNTPPYVLIGKSGLKSMAELKGKTVSVGQVNDIATVYFERLMAAHGLPACRRRATPRSRPASPTRRWFFRRSISRPRRQATSRSAWRRIT